MQQNATKKEDVRLPPLKEGYRAASFQLFALHLGCDFKRDTSMPKATMAPRPAKAPKNPSSKALAKVTAGQPPKILDEEQLKRMGEVHCTIEDMAHILGCSRELIYDKYSDMIEKARAGGKMSLRRKMWEKATNGNGDTSMLIWLSKQLLGFRDKQPDEASHIVFNVSVSEVPK